MLDRRDVAGRGPVVAGPERAAVAVVAGGAEDRVEQPDLARAAGQLQGVVVAVRVVGGAGGITRRAGAVADMGRRVLVAVLAPAAGREDGAPEALRGERAARLGVGDLHRLGVPGRGRGRGPSRHVDAHLQLSSRAWVLPPQPFCAVIRTRKFALVKSLRAQACGPPHATRRSLLAPTCSRRWSCWCPGSAWSARCSSGAAVP